MLAAHATPVASAGVSVPQFSPGALVRYAAALAGCLLWPSLPAQDLRLMVNGRAWVSAYFPVFGPLTDQRNGDVPVPVPK